MLYLDGLIMEGCSEEVIFEQGFKPGNGCYHLRNDLLEGVVSPKALRQEYALCAK